MIVSKKTTVYCVITLSLLIGLFIYFYALADNIKIRLFDEEKDYAALVKLMNNDLFLLSESRDFIPEKVLMRKSPDYEKKDGLASFVVAEVDKQTAGFIAYYKKNFNQGYIWLLGVDKNFRRKGVGKKLLLHAIKDLQSQNISFITIAVRSSNNAALGLYKSVGFVEYINEKERQLIILRKVFD